MKPPLHPEPGYEESAERLTGDRQHSEQILRKLSGAPKSPGVYLMKDGDGRIIYVGKAANLKSRLSSYFSRSPHMDPKTGVLVRQIVDFETVVTGSEKEALILESNLIKKYKPRYNVILKDDKRYPSLRLDIRKPYPNLTVVRKIKKDGALYFGPYASAGAVRETLRLIHRHFRIRKCKHPDPKKRKRPCLNYQINACPGMCSREVDPAHYGEIVNEVRMFLNGRTNDLVRKIRDEMKSAAERQDFETAAQLRDKMYAVEQTLEKQVMVTTDFIDRDIIAVKRSEELAVVILLKVRNGSLRGMRDYIFNDPLSGEEEIVSAFIGQYYENTDNIPREILTCIRMENEDLYGQWLSGIKERRVSLLHPRRGKKVRLLEMANENAGQRLQALVDQLRSDERLLSGLQQRLGINRFPRRIECIDNSGMSGMDMVSGVVVFEDAKPKKSEYRRYRIRTVDIQDDYACMAEVLTRRYGNPEKAPEYPDILMVDGGKGQLNIALRVLEQLGLEERFQVIGIAKRDEKRGEPEDKIYLPGRVNPVNFGRSVDQINLLKQVRDEAHRFAVTFHRKRRASRALESILDDIPGIGKKRKTVLLKHYSGIDEILGAAAEEIGSLPGMNPKVAADLLQALSGRVEK